jgi:hypothetical protein
MPAIASGSIEPEPSGSGSQVTVHTSAYVDDFGIMHYAIYDDGVSIFFGRHGEEIDIGLTDKAMMNLALLVNRAVCVMLRARGIPVPVWTGQEQAATQGQSAPDQPIVGCTAGSAEAASASSIASTRTRP